MSDWSEEILIDKILEILNNNIDYPLTKGALVRLTGTSKRKMERILRKYEDDLWIVYRPLNRKDPWKIAAIVEDWAYDHVRKCIETDVKSLREEVREEYKKKHNRKSVKRSDAEWVNAEMLRRYKLRTGGRIT